MHWKELQALTSSGKVIIWHPFLILDSWSFKWPRGELMLLHLHQLSDATNPLSDIQINLFRSSTDGMQLCLYCVNYVLMVMVGWREGHAAGMVICLERDENSHMAQLMPLALTVSCSNKSELVLPFWYRLTRVVPDNGPLNGCCCCFVVMT